MNLGDVRKAVDNPTAAVKHAAEIVNQRYNTNLKFYNKDGIDIFAEDWDNLIILDACRYDIFAEMHDLPGELESRISRGSSTSEFIWANFANREIHDLVYVSSNPYYQRLKDEIRAEVYKYILTEKDAINGLSVYPSTVTDAAIDAADEHTDKRLLIHYMQPHQPFLGPRGQQLDYKRGLNATVRHNNLSRAEVFELYRENLQLALDEVKRLLPNLQGKTVVTADHGELIDDPQSPIPIRTFSHPEKIYVDPLVKVPWLVIDDGSRRTISTDDPVRNETSVTIDEIDDHLQDLGYID